MRATVEQGHHLGVGVAGWLRKAPSDDGFVFDENRTYAGVRCGGEKPFLGEGHRLLHIAKVVGREHCA